MRRTAIRCTSATCSTATACGRGSARRSASPMARRRWSSSICFATTKPNAPINVFIHGGAWRTRAVKDYAFMAEAYVRAGAHWIGLDFDGVENTKGDLLPMADQVRRARRLGLQQRQELRRRSEPHLCVGPVVRRASRRLRRDHRLEGLRRAERHREGRAALLGHVRPEAGAAVEALGLCRLHRRERGEAVARSAVSTG